MPRSEGVNRVSDKKQFNDNFDNIKKKTKEEKDKFTSKPAKGRAGYTRYTYKQKVK